MMEPYTRYTTGLMVISDDYENIHSSTLSPSSRRTLSAIVSVRGDRRTTNPHQWTKTTADYAKGLLVLERPGAPSRFISGQVGFPPPNHGPEANLASAHTAALRKVVDAVTNDRVQLGVTLAELKETAATGGQILKATEKLAKSTSGARRYYENIAGTSKGFRTLKFAHKALREALSDAWLTWAVGVKPLIADVDNFFKMKRSSASEEYRYRVRETGSHKLRTRTSDKDPYGIPRTRDTNAYAGVRYVLDVYIDNPLLHLAQRIGLTSPLSSVWEATRLSFVVDYLYNVGDYLQLSEDLITASVNWQVEGSVTERRVITTTESVSGSSDVTSGQRWSGGYFGYNKLVSHDRKRVTSLPLRVPSGPELKLPSFAGQWATCAALLDGEIRKDRSRLPLSSLRRGWNP